MKIRKLAILAPSVLLMGCLTSCNNGTCKVTLNYYKGEVTEVVNVDKGKVMTKPIPTYQDYTFLDWYSDANFEYKFNFDLPICQDITLYAKWKVNPKDLKIEFPATKLNRLLFPGETVDLTYSTNPEKSSEGLNVKWDVSDHDKAEIDEKGRLKALDELGEFTVTCDIEQYHLHAEEKVTVSETISYVKTSTASCKLLNFSNLEATKYDIPEYVDINGERLLVTEIAEDAFKPYEVDKNGRVINSQLQTVNVPDSIQVIGDRAFQDMDTIQEVNFGTESYLKIIGEDAFSGCINLNSIYLGKHIRSIGKGSFEDCNRLSSLSINNEEGSECVIGESAFANCEELTEVKLDTVTSLGDYAFMNAPLFDKEALPTAENILHLESIKEIGVGALAGNKAKAFVTNNYLPTIDTEFYDEGTLICTSKSTIVSYDLLSDSCTIVAVACEEPHAAKECTCHIPTKAKILSVDKTITGVAPYAFYGNNFYGISMDNNIQTIGDYAFCGLSGDNTEKITLGLGVKEIGEGAFSYCENLKEFVFGGNTAELSSIPNGCFYGDRQLEKVIIPKNIVEIGEEAFSGCDALLLPTTSGNGLIFDTDFNPSWSLYLGYGYKNDVILTNDPETNAYYFVKRYVNCSWTNTYMSLKTDKLYLDYDNSWTNTYDLKTLLPSAFRTSDYIFSFDQTTTFASIDSNNIITITGRGSTDVTLTINIKKKDETPILKSLQVIIPHSTYYLQSTNTLFINTPALPEGANIVLPQTSDKQITSIAPFSNTTKAASIEIPEGYTEIQSQAFLNWTALSRVDLPNSITTIGENAFISDGSLLKEINFAGTKAEWEKKEIKTIPHSISIICTDGVIYN